MYLINLISLPHRENGRKSQKIPFLHMNLQGIFCFSLWIGEIRPSRFRLHQEREGERRGERGEGRRESGEERRERAEERGEREKHSMPWLSGETKNIYEYFNLYVFDTADLLHRKSFHPENKHQRDSQLSFQNRTREIYSSAFWPE